jgi:hypothetical protein
MKRKGENKTMAKETKDTKETACLSSGKKVLITHRRINVPGRQRDPNILRIDSWDCDKSQNCQNMNCLGKNRNGRIKNWT